MKNYLLILTLFAVLGFSSGEPQVGNVNGGPPQGGQDLPASKSPGEQVGEVLEEQFAKGAQGNAPSNRNVQVVQGQILLKLPVNIKMASLDLNIEGMDLGGSAKFQDNAQNIERMGPSDVEEGSANTLHLMPTRFAVNIVLVSALLFSLYCIKQMIDVCVQQSKTEAAL